MKMVTTLDIQKFASFALAIKMLPIIWTCRFSHALAREFINSSGGLILAPWGWTTSAINFCSYSLSKKKTCK